FRACFRGFEPAALRRWLTSLRRSCGGLSAVLVFAPDLQQDARLTVLFDNFGDEGIGSELVAGVNRMDITNRDLAAIHPCVTEVPLEHFVQKSHLVLA